MTRRRWIADEYSADRAALTGEHAAHLARTLRARVGQDGELGALAQELAGMNLDGQDARLQRIEDSLMRLERINQQTLALLQKLVGAMR